MQDNKMLSRCFQQNLSSYDPVLQSGEYTYSRTQEKRTGFTGPSLTWGWELLALARWIPARKTAERRD